MAHDLQEQFEDLTSQPSSTSLSGFLNHLDDSQDIRHSEVAEQVRNVISSREEAFMDSKKKKEENATSTPSYTSGLYVDDTPTPPIDVPRHSLTRKDDYGYGSGRKPADGYNDKSLLEEYITHNRRPSIGFAPEVKLDDGRRTMLEAPLWKLKIKVRPRRSLLQEISQEKQQQQQQREVSQNSKEEFDPETGERLETSNAMQRGMPYTQHQSRYPLMQCTVDELRAFDRDVSIISPTTISPPPDEVRTPIDAQLEAATSPVSILSPSTPWFQTASPSSPSTWPSLPRRLTASKRSKSSYESPHSLRRASRRSTTNSFSPASNFLRQWAGTASLPDPDSEGQEVGDYVLGREIGFGGFSVVREAFTFSNGERIRRAVKIVRRQLAGKEEVENECLQAEFEHEIALWRCLSHKHILPLIAVYVTDFATFAFSQLHAGGTLFDAVRANRAGLSPILARRYAYQLASAVRYLHEDMRIVHRDLKLENCLIDMSAPDAQESGGDLLLCDFGLADYMTGDSSSSSSAAASSSSISSLDQNIGAASPKPAEHISGPSGTGMNAAPAGSLQYASPELWQASSGLLSPRTDMWAFGVLVYALVTGSLPFQHTFGPRIRMMIQNGDWDRGALTEKEKGISGPVKDGDREHTNQSSGGNCLLGVVELVEGCLAMRPKYRWDVRRVLGSQWLAPEATNEDESSTWAS